MMGRKPSQLQANVAHPPLTIEYHSRTNTKMGCFLGRRRLLSVSLLLHTLVSLPAVSSLVTPTKIWRKLVRVRPKKNIIVFDDNDPDNHSPELQHGSMDATTRVDEYFMDMALQEAKKAEKIGEVPIGAIVVVSSKRQTIINNKSDTNREKCSTSTPGDIGKGSKKNKGEQQYHEPKQQSYYEVLSKGFNCVEQKHDASAHAELIALQRAGAALKNWRLSTRPKKCNDKYSETSGTATTIKTPTTTTTLYTTLEPCPMCLAASQAFRVNQIVYGAPDMRLGAVETHMNLIDVAPHPFHNITHIKGGVRHNECAALLRGFFQKRRIESKNKKKKSKQNTASTIGTS